MTEVQPNFKTGKAKKKTARSWPSPDEMGRNSCEAAIDPGCTRRATESHHVKTRKRGGSDDPINLLAVCLRCHSWIHHNIAAATERGWLRHAWD